MKKPVRIGLLVVMALMTLLSIGYANFHKGIDDHARDQIWRVQLALTILGYQPGTPDGQINGPTQLAIRNYQSSSGAIIDGNATPHLRAKLERIVAENQSSPFASYIESSESLSANLESLWKTKSCPRCYLQGANLQGAYLSKASLYRANLWEVNLERANLEGAILVEADLHDANLQDANFESAKLVGTNLEGSNLQRANFKQADLGGAFLKGANLSNANLRGANLEDADLSGVDLTGADLTGAILNNAGMILVADHR
jgi:hypothetical protein